MFRYVPRILRCLASVPMLFWVAITGPARQPGQTAGRSSPHDPGQYFADDPWAD